MNPLTAEQQRCYNDLTEAGVEEGDALAIAQNWDGMQESDKGSRTTEERRGWKNPTYMNIPFVSSKPAPVPDAPPVESALAIHRWLGESVEGERKKVGRGDGGRELAVAATKLQEVGYWLREAQNAITKRDLR